MRAAGTPIAEDLQERYAKACALLAEGDRQDFTGKPIALITYRWALSSKEFIERVSASEERERVLREALREARQSHSGCCIVIPSLQTAWQNMGKIVISGRDIPSSDYRCAACRIIDDALATPAPEQPAKKESE